MSSLVSVIITTCKGSDKLNRAIDSVLGQSYDNIEVIVVDDNGRGEKAQLETEDRLKRYRDVSNFKYIVHEKNQNGAVARNTGLKEAKGKYVAFLDDDDFFMKSRVECLVKEMEKQGYKAAYSNVVFIRNDGPEFVMDVLAGGFSSKDLLVNQSLLGTGSNIFVERELVQSINGFDESFLRYQDVEFMIRVLQKTQILGIQEYLVVKDISESRFYPKYENFVKAQEHFLTKFVTFIDKMDDHEKRECLLSKRTELLYSAYISKDKNNIKCAKQLLLDKVPDLTAKENFVRSVKGIYLKYVWDKLEFLRKIKNKKTAENLRENMDSEILEEIMKVIG